MVARAGYRTAAAANGSEALEYLRIHRETPCVVVLDLLMPVMDGRQVIDELERKGIPARLIVLTATGMPDLATGVRWLQKPVQRESLLADIAAICP